VSIDSICQALPNPSQVADPYHARRLHFPDKEEIESVLEGRNQATLAITEREKERAKLRGEAYSEALDGKLSVFGLNEHALFDWLEKDGWKESRFERLVTREMPD
jgi:hypothetical protein